MFNFHHLELFYYVARYGGIIKAVKRIPYGIQQPALSIQMQQLEEQIGVPLFHRRVFRLTPAGEYLYEFIRPVFDNLKSVIDRLRETSHPLIRVGASPFVLHEALPPLLWEVQRGLPGLHVDLKEASPSQIARLFEERQIDVAITVLNEKLPAGCSSRVLAELPPILLVRSRCRYRSAEELWKRIPVPEPLISPPPHDPISRGFQRELARRSIVWKAAMPANSLGLIETYVRHGFGIGLTLALPRRRLPAGLRALPLPGFPRVAVGAIWQGLLHPATEQLLQGLEKRARPGR